MSGMRFEASSAGVPSTNAARDTIARNETTNRIECTDASGNRVPFDSDKLFAAMAEVSSGANRTLDADDVGAVLVFTGSGTPTWTLPAANSLNDGELIAVANWGSGTVTVQRAGSDTIDGGIITSENVEGGAFALFASNGSDRWYRLASGGGGGGSAGYPVETTNNSTSYTLDVDDANSTIRKQSGSDAVFTFPAASTYDDGSVFMIRNESNARLAVAPPSGSAFAPWADDIRMVVEPGQTIQITTDGSNYHVTGTIWPNIDVPNAIFSSLSGTDDTYILLDVPTDKRYYILAAIIHNTTAETTCANLDASVGIAANYTGIFNGRILTSTGSQSAATNFSTDASLGIRFRCTSPTLDNADIPWVQLKFVIVL